MSGRKLWTIAALLALTLFLPACGSAEQTKQQQDKLTQSLYTESLPGQSSSSQSPSLAFERHAITPTATPSPQPTVAVPTATPGKTTPPGPAPTNIPTTGSGAAPYGAPPALTALEKELTQKLFAQINSDRAARNLYPYQWNETLAGGARLHSWNMFHCGFSHTCPDGTDQCKRIADEGFAGYTDCGESIGYAGPYPTPWEGVYKIHMTMVNEPPTGWHRIHMFSTTLHRIGIGIYVDPDGYIWFTEDMVS